MAKENPKGEIIKFAERMRVKATKKAKHLIVDQEYSLHPIAARKLIEKGSAVEVADTETKKK